MPRIAVGGFLHETNTFAPTRATYADFEPIAEKLLICAAPGAMPVDTAALPWTKLRPGILLKPNGPAFVATHASRSRSPAIG
jgi:microcystin degradation protein MlrC